ncbi:MAG: helix-turn-helix domain-containing protein [Bacillota bacterium]|nr:MAG: transcriptional regulator [Bacillota bacterium]
MGYERMCPRYERAVAILGKRWTGLILRILMGGPRRFSDFRLQVPALSERILSERLKELEEEGILRRVVYDTKPVRIEYILTEKGRALEGVVKAIEAWAERWVDPPPASLEEAPSGLRPATAPAHGEEAAAALRDEGAPDP